MRSIRITISYLTVFFLFSLQFVKAQTGDSSRKLTLAYVDSLVNNDSLVRDLTAFIDSSEKPKSLFAVEIGFGNGFFTSKNATAATGYSEKTFLTPTVSYLHKSGFGISASAYGTDDMGSFTVYQAVITPSYQISRKTWAAGVTYSRYLNKDSVSFAVNPMRNDVYAYGTYKKYWLEPGLAFDFSFDSYLLEENAFIPDGFFNPADHGNPMDQFAVNIHAHTFAGIFTVQHDFEWFNLLQRNDHVAFTPTLFMLANSANYDIAVIKQLKTGSMNRWAKSYTKNNNGSTTFSVESVGALMDAIYSYKHFLIDPQILGNYFLDASPGVRSIRVSYLINVGLVF